jgi:micrococcal nuclease
VVVLTVPAQVGAQRVLTKGPPEPLRETIPCELSRIVDGDTIECRRIGRIRLIGMDTPEAGQEPFGEMATRALRTLLSDATTVVLERDVEFRDRYERMLAYVWADGHMVNWALVRQGWAVVLTYPPNVQYVGQFTDADCLPRDRRRGRCE